MGHQGAGLAGAAKAEALAPRREPRLPPQRRRSTASREKAGPRAQPCTVTARLRSSDALDVHARRLHANWNAEGGIYRVTLARLAQEDLPDSMRKPIVDHMVMVHQDVTERSGLFEQQHVFLNNPPKDQQAKERPPASEKKELWEAF